jgi:dolichol kinase
MPGEASRIVVGALAATLLERFSGPIDDNLTMPLGAAIVLALVA